MVRWTETAGRNLRDIHDYIARESVWYAKRVAYEIYMLAEGLDQFPRKGRMVPEAKRRDIRELFLHSYRLIYKVRDDGVVILRILHMRQKRRQGQSRG